MDWTIANVAIQAVAGLVGAHAAAAAAHEHSFGFLGHSLVGLLAGLLSGYFLQTMAITVVTGSGSLNTVSNAEAFVMQIGAIAMFAVGFARCHGTSGRATRSGAATIHSLQIPAS
jgi:hypothetical protein